MRVKKNLLILFGGVSTEHDISHLSVQNIIKNVDQQEYTIYLVGITRRGKWIYVQNPSEIADKSWIYGNKNAYILPDAEKRTLVIMEDEAEISTVTIDLCFPVLHGKNGEDGTIQGLLELAQIPYVGCNVASSAVCLDKIFTKLLVESLDIRQAKYIAIENENVDIDELDKKVCDNFGYPVFIKPANCGSSIGVTKAENKEQLDKGIKDAQSFDVRILVEEAINGREIECAVYKVDETKALAVGEVIAGADFYDFNAKYNNQDSKTVVNPDLPEGVTEKVFDAAVKIFDRLNCYSLSRVDFFLEEKTNEIVFNEINTMPGFTNISMYPMLAQQAGISNKELINNLLLSALKRY